VLRLIVAGVRIFLRAGQGDLFAALGQGCIQVLEVRCPPGGLSTIAYARIKPQGGGDAKQSLGIMLTCCKQGLPKIAMVFDADVDIWDDDRIAQCPAFRYMPDRETVIIPQCNTMTTDPMVGSDTPPIYASTSGLDCTIPLVGNWVCASVDWSAACSLGDPPAQLKPMSEDDMVVDMTAFIKAAPRSWKEILQQYHGQPYSVIYRAFGRLRQQLGRARDSPWFRYTFCDHDFAFEPPPTGGSNFDPRHRTA
jgi:2,5-furandicarboxylate decarboxylase 1